MSDSIKTNEFEKGTSLWDDARQRLLKNKAAMISLWFIVAMLVLCFGYGSVIEFSDEKIHTTQNLQNRFDEISKDNWLGTDQLGRDLFARIITGGQISLLVGIGASIMTVLIGVTYGAVAGFIGGRTRSIMMRMVDGMMALPFIILVILLREAIKTEIAELADFLEFDWHWEHDIVLKIKNLTPLIIAIGAFGWLTMGRIVDAAAAAASKMEYVQAGRSLGLHSIVIIFKHIIPNILSPIIIYSTLTIPSFILYEATLSFIGLGIDPPNSSWGTLIKEGANYIETALSLLVYPSIFFSLTLLAFNFLGDGLRDALDPKSSKS